MHRDIPRRVATASTKIMKPVVAPKVRPSVTVSNWWYAVGFFFVGVPSVFVFWLFIYPFFIRLFY